MTTAVTTESPALSRACLADYVRLTKPRLSAMALVTVPAGAVLASAGAPDWRVVANALVGAALVAAGASALNQLMERDSDALMQRTRDRPLPAGRLRAGEVLVFGWASAGGGGAYPAPAPPPPLAPRAAPLTLP